MTTNNTQPTEENTTIGADTASKAEETAETGDEKEVSGYNDFDSLPTELNEDGSYRGGF